MARSALQIEQDDAFPAGASAHLVSLACAAISTCRRGTADAGSAHAQDVAPGHAEVIVAKIFAAFPWWLIMICSVC